MPAPQYLLGSLRRSRLGCCWAGCCCDVVVLLAELLLFWLGMGREGEGAGGLKSFFFPHSINVNNLVRCLQAVLSIDFVHFNVTNWRFQVRI